MPEKPVSDRSLSSIQIAQPCHHCEGKGYTEMRDCSGEIQREETCSFCNGTGKTENSQHKIHLIASDDRGKM